MANTEYDIGSHDLLWKAPAEKDEFAAYQLVGEVIAHQGDDG